jgi:hypothetical protein
MKGQGIGGVKSSPDGHALGQPGEAERRGQGKRREAVGEVVGGGFPGDVGSGGEDDLEVTAAVDSVEEFGDAEVLGPDVVQGGEPAAEGVVVAAEDPGALDGQDVGGLFHDAEEGRVPVRGGADGAAVRGGEEAAHGAGGDVPVHRDEGFGEGERGFSGLLEEPEGHAFGGAGADPGEALELEDEALEGGGIIEFQGGTGRDGQRDWRTRAWPWRR